MYWWNHVVMRNVQDYRHNTGSCIASSIWILISSGSRGSLCGFMFRLNHCTISGQEMVELWHRRYGASMKQCGVCMKQCGVCMKQCGVCMKQSSWNIFQLIIETHDGQFLERISPWASYVVQFGGHGTYKWIFWNPPGNEAYQVSSW